MRINSISGNLINTNFKKINKNSQNLEKKSVGQNVAPAFNSKKLSTQDILLYLLLAVIGLALIFKGMLPKDINEEEVVVTQVKDSLSKASKNFLDYKELLK